MARYSIADPYYWLTNATCSKDEQPGPGEDPYRPFPKLRYLLYLIRFFLDFSVEQGNVYKSRTMMASWSMSAAYFHYAATHPATKVVFQSQDEDRAVHDVTNCKILWENSIPRLKEKWPLAKRLEDQAYNRLVLANGSEIVGIPGDPKKIKSEHPTIYAQDESAIIEAGEWALNEAAATRCPRISCVSSAFPGWYADKKGRSKPKPYLHKPHLEYIGQYQQPIDDLGKVGNEISDASFLMHGMQYLELPKQFGGFPFIDLDIEADPEFRDPEKMKALENKFQPKAFFLREIKRQANALSGATIYPEFNRGIHVIPHDQIPKRGTLYMSLDPHPRTPHAALWVLIDGFGDWYVYREMWPSKIKGISGHLGDEDEEAMYTVKEYSETIVEMLEGNQIEWHHPETDMEYGVIRERPGGERVLQRFMDQAGKGFMEHSSATKSTSYALRYNACGLQFSDPKKSHEAGEDAVRELLKLRNHDLKGKWPRIHISDRCEELALEFETAKYRQMKRVDPDKELSQKPVEYRTHMLDNLRYLATSSAAFIPEFVSNRTDR